MNSVCLPAFEGALRSSLSSGGWAGLVTACDDGEVTVALELLLCDADRRRAMGAAGRHLVQQRFLGWPSSSN